MTNPVSGGVPEPAECELEAIAALFTSALSQVGNWQDRARYLFDRGVRIQDGAALERPRPVLSAPQDCPKCGGLDGTHVRRNCPGAALPPQTGNPPPEPLNDEQLLAAFVAGCNAENELNEAELSPQNVRRGVAAAMRGVLRGNL